MRQQSIKKDSLGDQSQDYRSMCYKCCRPKKACFCYLLEPFTTFVHFCFLMHPKEAKLSHVGTGRMTHCALKNSTIIVGENFDQSTEVQQILHNPELYPMLLYPGESSTNLSRQKIEKASFNGRRPVIFILDGTWPCAKSMMRDTLSLHSIPRLSFDVDSTSRYLIRHQPAKYCLSTIESVYKLLSLLEKHEIERNLDSKEKMLEALDKLVEFQRQCALDPSLNHYRGRKKGFKEVSERVNAKRWEHRKVCFEAKNYKK